MKPVEFPEANGIRTAPVGQPEVKPLPVYTDGEACTSRWQATWAERLIVLFTGKIWLRVRSGHTQPPVLITAGPLFERPKTRAGIWFWRRFSIHF